MMIVAIGSRAPAYRPARPVRDGFAPQPPASRPGRDTAQTPEVAQKALASQIDRVQTGAIMTAVGGTVLGLGASLAAAFGFAAAPGVAIIGIGLAALGGMAAAASVIYRSEATKAGLL